MQGLARRQPPKRWIEPVKYSVKRINFQNAFAVHHRPVAHDFFPSSGTVFAAAPALGPIGESFFAAKTLDQLIAEQGTLPIYDLSVFAGAIPDEDMDEFVADIYRTRT
jgi:hypothetical protein